MVNVEGAIRKDDRWLIIERSKKEEHAGGLLSLVGGKVVQEGNTIDLLESTVKREIAEEVSIRVKDNLQYVHNTSFLTTEEILKHPQAPSYLKDSIQQAEIMISV
jgi:8-oxo-dGTP pyrophosphatase MutT (NUDIX family)